MTKIQEEIALAIKKNLPAEVGDVLKGQLEELSEIRKSYKEALNSNERLVEQLEKCKMELNEVRSAEDILTEVKVKEERLLAREVSLYKVVADLKVAHSEDKVSLVKQMFSQVFRNTEVRKNVFDSNMTDQIVTDSQGYTHTVPVNNTKDYNETKTEE